MESDERKSKSRPKHPREGANIFSSLTFGWTLPMFWKGRKIEMQEDDLFETLKEHKASSLGDLFEKAWLNELERVKGSSMKPSLKFAVFKIFGFKLLFYGLLVFILEMVQSVVQPLMLGGLLDCFGSSDNTKTTYAYLYAAGLVLCSASSIFFHTYMLGLMHIGLKTKVGLSSLIYRKALRLSNKSFAETTSGQIVNLLSNDVDKFNNVFIYLHMLWVGPVETCIVTYFVWKLIGPASIIGLISLVIFIPFQVWMGKKVSQLRLKTGARTDERVRLMNEIISGIQVIKMYTWEKPFAKLVSKARRKEINVITKSSYYKGIMVSFLMFHSRTTIFLTLLGYILFGNAIITAQKVFVLTCFYNSLRQVMTIHFPFGLAYVAECFASAKRIRDFLLTNDLPLEVEKPVVPIIHVGEGEITEPIAYLEKVTARWDEEKTENTLTSIDIKIMPGKITTIIGPVGAGKSSLLHVLLKELPISRGSLSVNGSISYSSQEPWLFVGSVRQNILFGLPYDKDRYRQVVRVCALTTNFEQLPYGDKTLIGEKGVSLSGGQRARVSLARAVYKNADIYLLDDPLSAVDVHVGKHLFEDCIADFLRGKTVVLVTHQLQYLNNVHHIILLENGKVAAEGKFNELLDKGLDFTKLLLGRMNENKRSSRRSSNNSIASSNANEVKENDNNRPSEFEETMLSGQVKQRVYWIYLRAGGGLGILSFVILLFAVAQVFATGSDYWSAYWVNLEQTSYSGSFVKNRDICIYIFAGLTLGTIIMSIMRSFIFFVMCMKASRVLHDNMFSSLTRATMRFFHTNSSGRILNRFSSDMGSIDELLPENLADILQVGISLVGVLLIVVAINPWILIPTFIAAIIFYYLRSFYLGTARSVKRLDGITRSPVFAHLNASLQGLTSIRAYRAQKILISEFESHQDLHSTAWYLYLATHRAFGFWLDFVCLIYVGLVIFNFLVVVPDTSRGAVGLAITQAIGLVIEFQWGMRLTAELESLMTSVERVLEYANLYSEPPLESAPGKKPKDNWPDKGEIMFKEVSLRYSPHDTWVLKDISFHIKPLQKVGIVGRTGAGKSSLIAALFRLSETEGKILIDSIETKSCGLHDLRSKISIIPQEPVLFSGSLRKNLDPFDQYSDDVLWSSLEQVELKESVSELAGGLSAKMQEGGSNFSVGQRQLVCLARAIVRNNKILVLDEATANVDPKTDSLIQKTIRSKFANCTVLTIAHRLNTVMDSDRVLVMDAGALVEFDHPHLLLQNEYGFLSKMVEQTGKGTAEKLKQVANDCYEEFLRKTEEKSQ